MVNMTTLWVGNNENRARLLNLLLMVKAGRSRKFLSPVTTFKDSFLENFDWKRAYEKDTAKTSSQKCTNFAFINR